MKKEKNGNEVFVNGEGRRDGREGRGIRIKATKYIMYKSKITNKIWLEKKNSFGYAVSAFLSSPFFLEHLCPLYDLGQHLHILQHSTREFQSHNSILFSFSLCQDFEGRQ